MLVRAVIASACLVSVVPGIGCGSGGNGATCQSVCQAAAACPDPNDPFAAPPGTSCADSCASGQRLVTASRCGTQYSALIQCAGSHDQCSGEVATACQSTAVTFLQCVESYCSATPTPAACTGGGTTTDGGGAGGASGSGGAGGSDGGAGGTGGGGGNIGQCNAIVNTAPEITEARVAQAAPGNYVQGLIVPGTYYLTAVTVYTGPGGATGPNGVTHQQTELITAATAGILNEQVVSSQNGGAPQRASLVLVPTATSLRLSYACPTSPGLEFQYSVSTDGNAITIRTANDREETHTRQP